MKFGKSLLAFAGIVAALATLGHYFAKPLLAQARAALVRDIDNPALAPFSLDTTLSLTDPDTQQLLVTVPAGKRLVIENISYVSQGVTNDLLQFAGLRNGQLGPVMVFLGINPPQASASSPSPVNTGSQASKVYFDAGQEVWVTTGHSGGGRNFDIVLSGYWITP